MTWTVSSSGTFTPANNAEATLTGSTDATNATYCFLVDVNALAAGEVVEFRLYTTVLNAGTERICWKGTAMGGALISLILQSPFMPSDQSMHVTIKQLNGTLRAFPWKVLRA